MGNEKKKNKRFYLLTQFKLPVVIIMILIIIIIIIQFQKKEPLKFLNHLSSMHEKISSR
jgi:hypothetical protein